MVRAAAGQVREHRKVRRGGEERVHRVRAAVQPRDEHAKEHRLEDLRVSSEPPRSPRSSPRRSTRRWRRRRPSHPIPIPASDDDARTAADRYRTMRGSSSSGGDAADVGSSSGMVKIFALAAAFPSSMCLSTAAAWHDTESSPGPPAAPVVFPTSALARTRPRTRRRRRRRRPSARSWRCTSAGAPCFREGRARRRPPAAARSAASFPRVAARRHDSNAGSCFPAPRFTSAANRRSWHDRFSATRVA